MPSVHASRQMEGSAFSMLDSKPIALETTSERNIRTLTRR